MADYNSRYGGYDREDKDSHGDDALVSKQDKKKLSALADEAWRDAALVTFLVTASGFSLGGVGSALWGLLLGLATAALARRG